MKKTIIALAVLAASVSAASAQYGYRSNSYGGGYGIGSNSSNHAVQGYVTQQGTYVQPHYQTNPNTTTLDNYGTRGNINPYNGHIGTRSPYGR
jgi:hypothetical protein